MGKKKNASKITWESKQTKALLTRAIREARKADKIRLSIENLADDLEEQLDRIDFFDSTFSEWQDAYAELMDRASHLLVQLRSDVGHTSLTKLDEIERLMKACDKAFHLD